MQKSKIMSLLFISLLGLFSLIFSIDIKQKNPDTIFLTDKSIEEYNPFKKDAPEKFSLILMREITDSESEKDQFYFELNKFENICSDDCEIISAKTLKEDGIKNKGEPSLMNLEGNHYLSAIFLDNSERNHKKILEEALKNSFWQNKTKFAGMSYTNFLLDRYSESIQNTLFPAMFIMGFLLTLFFIKDLKESLMIYLPCLYMAGVSLLTLKILDGSMNMVTSIIPLVVFTISLSLSFHVFYSIKEFATIKKFLNIKWRPLFLMIFTTYVGFLSLYVAEISVVKTFGLVSSQLILFSVFVLYLWYKNLEKKIYENPNRGRVLKIESIFHHTIPLPLIVVLSILGVFSAWYFPNKLPIITDATRYFPSNSNLRSGIIEVTQKVSGMPLTEILIDLESDLNEEQISKMNLLELDLVKILEIKKMKLLSLNNLLRQVNIKYSGENKIPDNLPSYFTLRSQLPVSLQEGYLVENHYRLTVLGSPMDVHDYEAMINEITQILNKHQLKYRINGLHHNLMTSQKSMITILYESFLVSGVLVFVVSALYLQNLRLIVGFAVVNIIPILFAFLYMYVMGYSVNIATVMTFSIALGLLGDSTFHISHAKIFPFKSFSDYSSAVLTPVLLSGVLLFLCFVIFLFNDFHPIKEFGGILAFMIFGGYFADLFILPSIIYGNHKHRHHYEKEIEKKSHWFIERDKRIGK